MHIGILGPFRQLRGHIQWLRLWASVTLCSRKADKRSNAVRRRKEFFATRGGPAVTALLTAALVSFYCLIFFEGAEPSNAFDGLRSSGTVCGLATVLLAAACHLVDPGAPRADLGDLAPAEGDEAGRVRTRTLDNGMTWTQKFCRDCRVWRPHRCGHCHWCHRCVLRLDHHCLFVGTCIGEGNMRFFAAFLLCAGAAFFHGLVAVSRCMYVATCWSTHHRLDRWVGPTLGALIHKFYVLDGIVSLAVGALVLTTAGIVYVATMIGDVDLHNCRSLVGIKTELQKLPTCSGLRTYCCSPILLRGQARRRASTDALEMP
uniref:Palmitoyltransferase n=1 Tax=Alexandrium andersonii TaxID=327968 RepID=A0A7S2HGE9_9DINO|mmetsp:Transcript_71242/g.159496  ORF Transcript_71242/g.159496 Transcript_71242/m.159496 type:complete len:317 (+) Transcript_71242:57-1007(+)